MICVYAFSYFQTFWGGLIKDLLLSPPSYICVVQVLEFIRGELSDLAAADERRLDHSSQQQNPGKENNNNDCCNNHSVLSGTTTAATVNGIIDIELIQQQIDHGAVDWESWSSLVHSVVLVIECLQDPEYAKQTRKMYVEICKNIEKMKKKGGDEEGEASPQIFWWQYALCDALDFLVVRTCVARRNSINRK